MSELEERLGAIMSNPQLMQQIMSMAQSLGASPEPPKEPPRQETPSLPDFDPAMLQKISGLVGQSGIDREQQALLSALGPYISRDRVTRLEKAMRAAKMARAATALFGHGGLSILAGR